MKFNNVNRREAVVCIEVFPLSDKKGNNIRGSLGKGYM